MANLRLPKLGELVATPDPRQDRGGDTEGNHIRQGIELSPEIAGGVCHASDAPVETVKYHRETNSLRRIIKMERCAGRPLNSLGNRVISSRDIARGEKRGQHVHTAPHAMRLLGVVSPSEWWLQVHRTASARP